MLGGQEESGEQKELGPRNVSLVVERPALQQQQQQQQHLQQQSRDGAAQDLERGETDANGGNGGRQDAHRERLEQQRHDQLTPLLRIETEKDFQRSFKENQGTGSRLPWTSLAGGRRRQGTQHKHKRNVTLDAPNPASGEDCFGNKDEDLAANRENSLHEASGAPCPNRAARFAKSQLLATAPALVWLPRYDVRKNLVRDVLIGITLGFVIAPKAMAHALLAELSPIHGIYTAFFSTLVYGFMGNSKWLSLGTCALPALLFGEALLATGFTDQATLDSIAPMLTLYIGLWTLLMLVLRLDKLVVLIPPAVLAAFTTTAAFLIGTSQVKYLFGVHIEASGFVQTYVALFKHIGETNPATVVLSVFNIALLVASKKATARWGRKRGIPDAGAMFAVLVSVALVAIFDLDTVYDIEVAGETPQGMPPFTVPWQHISDTSLHMDMMLEGMIIAVINFVLAIAIAKSFARRSNSDIKVSQELKALGAVNTIGSFFGAQVAGGSFSGSAIIASLQADTLLHNFVNSFVMMLILVALTPVIEMLPKATLAAIIVVALPSLVDFHKPIALARVKTDDFVLWVVTFIVTLFGGVQWGIICGAALALVVLIRRNMGSECPELGVLPGTNIYRALDRFPDAKRLDGLRIFRLDASLSFANFERFEEALEAAALRMAADHARHLGKDSDSNSSGSQNSSDSPPSTIILSCEAVNDLDTAALEMLCRFASVCEANDILLLFSGWKSGERRTLYAAAEAFKRSHRASKATTTTPAEPAQPSGQGVDVPNQAFDVEAPSNVGLANTSSLEENNEAEDDLEESQVSLPAPLDPKKWFLNLHDAVVRSQGLEVQPCVSTPGTSDAEEADSPGFSLTLRSPCDNANSGGAGAVASATGQPMRPWHRPEVHRAASNWGMVGHADPQAAWGGSFQRPSTPTGAAARRASDLVVVKKRTQSTPVIRTTELVPGGKTHFHTYAQRGNLPT
ncbi:Sulfate transporter [Hondaea fermentalgiana]|uniref:Sulfate transporter n=1 Tax=Hondaea fermentalgiana TaxID=2315210 RepID=A0A2R5G2X2_9STRA|nr:Sulfate transporter [Hondaea fermentalgiana]|eukprot:GBG24078.1 Sulfate transporter [Hondaea fermentalgiana]